MLVDLLSVDEGGVATLERQPRLKLIPPRLQVKPSSHETVAGNKYDIVLACQPDAQDNYSLYDEVVKLVEKKGKRIYSPHNDFKTSMDLEDAVRFTVTEAIPRTKGVLVHLTTITPEIQRMFNATYWNNRPFVLFYSQEVTLFDRKTGIAIRALPSYRVEFVYFNDEHAINLLEEKLEELTRES